MKYSRLGLTDLEVSSLGFGAATLGNEYGAADEEEGMRAIHQAIDLGINYFDVAPYYGRTLAEKRLGRALVGYRDRVIVATKCCRDGRDLFDFSRERVLKSVDESLFRLKTDYVDLLQVHDIEFGSEEQIVNETIPALQSVKESGKARFIGITGLPLGPLKRVADRVSLDSILSYCQYNLLADRLDRVLGDWALEKGIGLINASPLHMRILSDQGAPEWHPAPDEVKRMGASLSRYCRERGSSIVHLALQFCFAYSKVSTTLVGMSTPSEVRENVSVFEREPDEALIQALLQESASVRNRLWLSGLEENKEDHLEQ